MARKKVKVTLAAQLAPLSAAPTAERVMHAIKASGDVINTKTRYAITSSFELHYKCGRITYTQYLAGNRLLHAHAATVGHITPATKTETVDNGASSDGPQHSNTHRMQQYYDAALSIPYHIKPAFNWFVTLNTEDAPLRTLGALYPGAVDINSLTARGSLMLHLLLDHLCRHWGYTVEDE